jgi:hypothetical protein
MVTRAEVVRGQPRRKPRMRLKEVSVAIVVGARESRVHGEGPHRERRQVVNTLNAKAWEPSPMSVEHERQKTFPGVAVCDESRTHGDNGGDEETGRKIPRLVPIHWEDLGW